MDTGRGSAGVETPAPTTLDVERIRRDFPVLHQDVKGKPLVYLDNAASTQKPRQVIEAIAEYYAEDHSNVHRGVHTLSQRATNAYEAARSKVANFLNVGDVDEVVFTRGATEAINLVASSWGQANLEPGDEVLITWMEHHSNIVPWQLACERTGAILKVAPVDDRGVLDLDAFRDLLGPRTKMAAFVHISNTLGTVNPVRDMVAAARDVGAVTLVDGAQATPHGAVDVADIGCDFYCFSGHKVYGPTGIGALWGRKSILADMPPYHGGGEMVADVWFEKTLYNGPPARFEAGTPNIAGAVGLGAALDYLGALGADAIAAHEHRLLEYATEKLSAFDGLRIIGTAPDKASVISFVLGDIHSQDIGTIVDMHGVAVRTGRHCTAPLMRRMGVDSTTRASFGIYNTQAEVDTLVEALHDVVSIFG